MSEDNADLYEEITAECAEHLEELESSLLALEHASPRQAEEIVGGMFRAAHSIKGVSAFAGLNKVKDLAHAFEDVLAVFRQERRTPLPRAVDLMFGATDTLKKTLAAAVSGRDYDIQPALDGLARVLKADETELMDQAAEHLARVFGPAMAAGGQVAEFEQGLDSFTVRFASSMEAASLVENETYQWLVRKDTDLDIFAVRLCLREALLNAVIHGNRQDSSRLTTLKVRLAKGGLILVVMDQGQGFGWRDEVERPFNPRSARGRGLTIMKAYAGRLAYNEKGNELTLEFGRVKY